MRGVLTYWSGTMASRLAMVPFFVGVGVLVAYLTNYAPGPPHLPLASSCAIGRQHAGLERSMSPQLQKLHEYEQACGGAIVDELMLFAPMPTTMAEAESYANSLARRLEEFARFSVLPLVVFEPTRELPEVLTELRAGVYDDVLAAYYEALRREGVRDATMGTWVLYPEANTPAWRTTDPRLFAANVTALARMQKQYFPGSRVSLLLDSRTYASNDTHWQSGKTASLVPYVKDIPRGLVDRVGLQSFPWVGRGDDAAVQRLSAADYLPAHLIREMARQLGVQNVWLNTGTFSRMHAGVDGEVTMGASKRAELLEGTARVAATLMSDEFMVTVNVFAQDKAKTEERVDWSYWHTGARSERDAQAKTLTTFLRLLRGSGVRVSLYDIR